MSFFGVELFSCSCNRYVVIDAVISLVVVAVSVPIFVTVPASRVYTGILLGVAVIFFCKLWRFLPSHRRWVEREARKRAEVLVSEWRTTQPCVAVPCAPTIAAGVAKMSATHPTLTEAASVDGGPLSPYGYPSRCSYYSPYHEPPYALPAMTSSSPPPLMLLPAVGPSRSSISSPLTEESYNCHGERGEEEEERVWGLTPPQLPAPWRLHSPAESPLRTSPSRRLRSTSLPPPSALAMPRDSQRAFMAVGEHVGCPREPRSSRAASTPAHCNHLSRSHTPVRDVVYHRNPALLPLRSRSPRERSQVLPAHFLPASYGLSTASARSGSHQQQQQQSQYHRSHSPTQSVFDEARRQRSRKGSRRQRRRSCSGEHRVRRRSSASSYSVPSSDSSLDNVNLDRDVRYAVRSHFSSAYAHQ